MHRKRELLCSVILAAHVLPAWAQPVTSAGTSVNLLAGDPATIPNLSGTWGHYSFPGIEPPATGPGPVLNKSRRRQSFDDSGRPYRGSANAPLVSNNAQLVGDYSNPILKPQAAEAVKKYGDIELSGHPAPNPSNQCWPNAVPYAFWNLGVQILQEPDKVTILQVFNHEFREVRLNQPHPARPTPSWHGDLVGHYEGDTLVIDTVAIKIGPFAMVDHYGTPYSEALHVIERYRLIDYETAKEALARDAKENWRFPVTNDFRGDCRSQLQRQALTGPRHRRGSRRICHALVSNRDLSSSLRGMAGICLRRKSGRDHPKGRDTDGKQAGVLSREPERPAENKADLGRSCPTHIGAGQTSRRSLSVAKPA